MLGQDLRGVRRPRLQSTRLGQTTRPVEFVVPATTTPTPSMLSFSSLNIIIPLSLHQPLQALRQSPQRVDQICGCRQRDAAGKRRLQQARQNFLVVSLDSLTSSVASFRSSTFLVYKFKAHYRAMQRL